MTRHGAGVGTEIGRQDAEGSCQVGPAWRGSLLVGLVEMDGTSDGRLAEPGGELVDRIAEPLSPGASGLVKAELAWRIAWLERGRRDPAQPDATALAGLDRDLRQQSDRGPREHAAIAGRRLERGAPGDQAEVVVLDDQDDRARAERSLPQAYRDAIRLIEEQYRELALVVDVVVERLLVTDRD